MSQNLVETLPFPRENTPMTCPGGDASKFNPFGTTDFSICSYTFIVLIYFVFNIFNYWGTHFWPTPQVCSAKFWDPLTYDTSNLLRHGRSHRAKFKAAKLTLFQVEALSIDDLSIQNLSWFSQLAHWNTIEHVCTVSTWSYLVVASG